MESGVWRRAQESGRGEWREKKTDVTQILKIVSSAAMRYHSFPLRFFSSSFYCWVVEKAKLRYISFWSFCNLAVVSMHSFFSLSFAPSLSASHSPPFVRSSSRPLSSALHLFTSSCTFVVASGFYVRLREMDAVLSNWYYMKSGNFC